MGAAILTALALPGNHLPGECAVTTLRQTTDLSWTTAAGAQVEMTENEPAAEIRRPARKTRLPPLLLATILIVGPLLAGAVVVGYGIIRFKWLG